MAKDLSGAQTGMSPSNPVNNPRPANQRGRNIFPQSYLHLTTERYGEYSPFFWAKCERGDVQTLNSSHNLHTYTLKSPMVSDVTMTKSYFKVPMYAIYPRNWEKMFTIPTQGDDVPADTRAILDITTLVSKISDFIRLYDTSSRDGLIYIRAFLLLESICSHGSLFEKFNMHFNTQVEYDGDIMSMDKFMDLVFYPEILRFAQENNAGIYGDDDSVFVPFPTDPNDFPQTVSTRRFFELIRNDVERLTDHWADFSLSGTFSIVKFYSSNNPHINIEPIIAYQLALAQFATNDFVDFIYSAQLYRDNMQSLTFETTGLATFLYNGVVTQYDVFSAHIFNSLISYMGPQNDFSEPYDYFLNLFSFVPSLRYGDYFTGAKPQPLAVGEYSAQVNNNEVSAIDITRSIQMQRLLHRVNMVGRKIGDYISGIFGGRLPEASKDVPIFLAHQKFPISGFETENTAEVQFNPDLPNSITSHLRSADSRHAFEIEIEEPCYIIGVSSYESMRVYSKTLDRFAFHHDRYDDFIPEMQYIGDQDINLLELDSSKNDRPFGYALRYMEYKQRYSYASGGFIENLPSWAFITDNTDGNPSYDNISPDYIRSSPSEFDRFYKSLNGYSLGSYFHFIVAHMNHSEPVRMMDYQPEILK